MTEHNEFVRLLLDEANEEDGWLSDAQSARPESDYRHRYVAFCGEGSIDVSAIASLAERVWGTASSVPARPWLHARGGEVWVIDLGDGEPAACVVDDDYFMWGSAGVPIASPSILDGERIWPVTGDDDD